MAKKETPKLSEMKAPRRKAAVSYTPRRNPEAEKVMGSQAARERAIADRATESRFTGESVPQRKIRDAQAEETYIPPTRRSTDAPSDTRRLLRPGMLPPVTKLEVFTPIVHTWDLHQKRFADYLRDRGLTTPRNSTETEARDRVLHETAVRIHRDTVTHGQACETKNCGASDHTTVNGLRIHGVAMDNAGFASDPRIMGTLRADGTRVGERAKTLDEIKQGLTSAAKPEEAGKSPSYEPLSTAEQKNKRKALLRKRNEEKTPDVTPENIAPTLIERIKSGDMDAEKFDRDMNIGRNTPRRISSIQGTTLEGTTVEDKK